MANSQRNGRGAVGGHNTVPCCRSSSGEGRRCTCSDMTDLRQDGLAVCCSIPRPRRCPLRCREISVYDTAKQTDCPARPVGWVAVCRASRAICSPPALRFLNPPTCGGFVTEALFEPICVARCDDRDPSARRRNRRKHRWKHNHERTRKRKKEQRSSGVLILALWIPRAPETLGDPRSAALRLWAKRQRCFRRRRRPPPSLRRDARSTARANAVAPRGRRQADCAPPSMHWSVFCLCPCAQSLPHSSLLPQLPGAMPRVWSAAEKRRRKPPSGNASSSADSPDSCATLRPTMHGRRE